MSFLLEKCQADKVIPEEILNDDRIDELLFYTPVELKLCLTKENLVNNISAFSDYPFTDEQLTAVKDKLDEVINMSFFKKNSTLNYLFFIYLLLSFKKLSNLNNVTERSNYISKKSHI